MLNIDLSRLFDEIADLMEIKGEDPFRINTYRKVARVFKDTTEDIAALSAAGKLTQLAGVGKGTADRVAQYLKEGKIDAHQELLSSVPAGLPALLAIPGLGPKRIALMWRELGVTSMDDLKGAIASGRLESLAGMGAKSVEKIRQGIEFLERSSGRIPVGLALPLAQEIRDAIAKMPGVRRVEFAGSLRRGQETIGDADILCDSSDGAKVVQAFTSLPQVRQVLSAGQTKGSVLMDLPNGGQIQVDLRVVEQGSYGSALQYFTGSKAHNVRLREVAIKKGLKLNEYGLFKDERQLAGENEEGIYSGLGLPLIPPELREDRGEIEAGKTLPKLVELSDIRGDLHMHTTASDGHNTIEEMAEAAKRLGYEYIAISDHSKSQTIANGLSIEAMRRQIDRVRKAAKRIKGIRILLSAEVDILGDGSLDYPDDILAECDLVIASIHSGLTQERSKVTARTLAAIRSPYVHIIGHPTGRLIGLRDAMDLDIDEVIRAASETGTALEINASWQRLDLCDIHARRAVEAGVRLVINTDAHDALQMKTYMPFGVAAARRGWASADAIPNTYSLIDLEHYLQSKHVTK